MFDFLFLIGTRVILQNVTVFLMFRRIKQCLISPHSRGISHFLKLGKTDLTNDLEVNLLSDLAAH